MKTSLDGFLLSNVFVLPELDVRRSKGNSFDSLCMFVSSSVVPHLLNRWMKCNERYNNKFYQKFLHSWVSFFKLYFNILNLEMKEIISRYRYVVLTTYFYRTCRRKLIY